MVAGTQYKFRFGSKFVGLIKPGSISERNGVRVQVKWAWLGIFQVDRVGDQLNFKVGSGTVSFPVSAFTNSPTCS
uniref:Uncharacterized protein n=1 Tax=Leersia perrieri TaxID=77586 RepID=A0A0D9VUU5_9ORYZ